MQKLISTTENEGIAGGPSEERKAVVGGRIGPGVRPLAGTCDNAPRRAIEGQHPEGLAQAGAKLGRQTLLDPAMHSLEVQEFERALRQRVRRSLGLEPWVTPAMRREGKRRAEWTF